jgi:hypothetical protein
MTTDNKNALQTSSERPQVNTTNKRYSSVANMPGQYPELDWTVATYRWLIFNKNDNGFANCLLKVRTRLIIDLDKFEAWLEGQSLSTKSVPKA